MKKIILFILFPFILFSQTQVGNDIDGEAEDDQSGKSVSLSSDGTIVAIGSFLNDGNGNDSGHIRVYENILGVWTQTGSDIDGKSIDDRFGFSVSLSADGTVMAIGAPSFNGNLSVAGYVRVYSNQAGVWTQIGNDIGGEAANDLSGWSVTLSSDGSIVAIGAPNNRSNAGHVRVYSNQTGIWTQIGNDIDGEAAGGDSSGYSVSLSSDGTVVAIGAIGNEDNGSFSGHVRIYSNQVGVWTQIGNDIDGEATFDSSGSSVSLSSDGTVVAIGAPFNNDNGFNSGHVRVYSNQVGVWTQIGNDIDGEAAGDQSGFSVSLSSDGTVVAIGANTNNGNGLTDSGHVRIYSNQAGVWTQIGNDIDGEAVGDLSGWRVSLSSNGNVVAIGAPFNDGSSLDSGHVRVYDLSTVLSSDSFVLSQFNVYPNPVKEQFKIQLQEGLELQSVNIYNSLGQFIKSINKNVINSSELSAGIYYLEITTNKGKASKKIVVN